MNVLLWGLLFFGALAVLLLLRFKIGVALFIVSLVGAILLYGFDAGVAIALRASFESVSTFTLLAIPLFILMGELIFQTGLAGLAIGAMDRSLGKLRGRLAYLAVLAGGFFGVLSGSSVASTGVLAGSLLPEMVRRRYNPEIGIGSILGAGGLAMVLPPSAVVIILGSTAGISVGPLLIAGLLPGILMLLGYLIVTTIQVYGRNMDEIAPDHRLHKVEVSEVTHRVSGGQVSEVAHPGGSVQVSEVDNKTARVQTSRITSQPGAAFKEFSAAFGLLAIAIITLSGILLGAVTPSEAAALGLVATVIMAVLFRRFNMQMFSSAVRNTASITGMIFFLIIAAGVYAQVLARSGLVAFISSGLSGLEVSPVIALAIMILLVVALGLFLESIAIVLLTMPLFMPVVTSFGIEPLWFGIVMIVAIQIGTITPPFGMNLFVMRGFVSSGISMARIYKSALPFVLSDIAVIVILLLVPSIVLFLPSLM